MNPSTDDPPPPEPIPPDDLDCCGNGCDPCVFDLHAQALQRWRRERLAWEQRQAGRRGDAPAA